MQIVLDYITASAGASLANFTPQELSDLVGTIDDLTAAKHAGADITSTVSSIKNVAMNEPQVMAVLSSAGQGGQPTDGTGDIGNYVPLIQGSKEREFDKLVAASS